MMSRSKSLTVALKAVERVMESDSSDLKVLAEVAGIEPERLYQRADLTGIDLRGKDIEFLLPLLTKYEGAILTDEQRRAFRKADRTGNIIRTQIRLRNIRADLITLFIESYEEKGQFLQASSTADTLTSSSLKEILLEPAVHKYRSENTLPPQYINSVLNKLATYASSSNFEFFMKLFTLLSDLRCEVDVDTRTSFKEDLWPAFEDALGNLVGAFYPTSILDTYWVVRSTLSETLAAASQIAFRRPVDETAVEKAVEAFQHWEEVLSLLKIIQVDCDMDTAERLATYITRGDWAASETRNILEAKTPPKIRNAIFRQLLAEGREERVAEIVRWLDNNRGAAGALSLENAFVHIRDFELAFRLAQDIATHLADNQISVIDRELSKLAYLSTDRERLAGFRRKYVRTSDEWHQTKYGRRDSKPTDHRRK